ncbi:PTPRT-like protein, partial [Mya arenaria]
MFVVLEWISFLCLVLRVAGVQGDIAHEKGANPRHSDNIRPNPRYADLAVDVDPKTCSSTDFANSSRTEQPWWRIWFPNTISFSNIELTIKKTTLQYIYNVSVSVTNMSEPESKIKTLWPTPDHHCYHGDGFKLSNDSEYAITRFYCISLSFGNTIKITLGSSKSQLEICDVNINQACAKTKWGKNCNKTCGQCATEECNSYNGFCETGCKAGYQLNTCQEPCNDGSFGVNCSGTCNSTCKGPCNKIYGLCLDCQRGWTGSYCDKECPGGYYGSRCIHGCGYCLNGTCDRVSGNCLTGCKPGYQHTPLCYDECPNGTFGLNCSQNCSEHCERTCDHVDGNCSCQKGYQLPMCINECELGTWGKNCSQTCGGCHSENCNKTTGQCLSGCKPGYKITSDCMEECDAGKYGNNCAGTCSKNCEDPKTCNKTNGFCASCEPGWRRPKCNDSCPDLWYGQNCQETCGYCAECEAGSHGVDCQERCGMCAEDKVCHPGNGTCPLGCKTGFSGEGCTQKLKAPSEPYTVALGVGGGVLVLTIIAAVVVVLVMRKRKAAKSQKNLPANITQKSAEIQHLGTSKAPKKSTDGVEESMKKQDKSLPVAPTEDPSVVQEPTYGNMMDEEGPRKPVTLSHLLSYIVTKSADQTYFRNEYAAIPTGMIHPATAARDPANAGKSRYKNLYAYDHSRVHLKKQQGGTDYINACYIQGYSGRPEYIASQGPMDAMIEDFIRMIWEKDVITVVMVTNLVELGKIKCLQYWGEVNVEKEIGMFVVVLTAEQEKSDFVTNRDVARSVRQFHYTAWPDKDVPDSPASLLVFWYTVRAYDPRRAGPWLSQYKFLHEVMYEALVLSSWPVPVDEFPKEHQRLLQVDPVLNKTNILLEYENEKAYQTMVLSKVRLDSDGQEIDAFRFAKLPENVGKNRSQSVLAQNMYRPFLRTPVSGRNDYINAVYIPTLSDRYAFVVSQTPLEYTLVDFCRLIHDHNIRIVVSFPDEGRELVGRLPTSGSSTIGPFTVRLEKEKTSDSIIHRKYSLANKTGGKKEFCQLVYKKWTRQQVVPSDQKTFVQLLQEGQFQFCHDVALDHANTSNTYAN